MGDTYTSAALRGFGDETYTSAALRGFGEDTYTSAALRGFGDETYTSAALRGFGKNKLRKGSPEAKAYMAKLRAMRGSGARRAGKKVKGGIALSAIGTAIGLIPTAIKGAQAIYNGIKWLRERRRKGRGCIGKTKGGYVVLPAERDEYIEQIKERYPTPSRARANMFPYGLKKSIEYYESRKKKLSAPMRNYLESLPEHEQNFALLTPQSIRLFKKRARDAGIPSRTPRTEDVTETLRRNLRGMRKRRSKKSNSSSSGSIHPFELTED